MLGPSFAFIGGSARWQVPHAQSDPIQGLHLALQLAHADLLLGARWQTFRAQAVRDVAGSACHMPPRRSLLVPRRCSPTPTQLRAHQHSALLRWTDRRTHGVALRRPRQRHSPTNGPSRRARRRPCYAHTKPFALATGGVRCHVRSGLPTKRRCVRRNPAAQRAASLSRAAHTPCRRAGGRDPQGLCGRRDG